MFQESLDALADLIKSFRIDPADPNSREKLEQLRTDYVKARFMSPAIKEQVADTYTAKEPQRTELLTQAAEQFLELFQKYSRYPQGSYSRFAAARCYQKLGKVDEALTQLVELLSDKAVSRAVKLEVAVLGLECWESKSPPAFQDIVGRIGEILETATPSELRDPKLVRLQLGYAKACKLYADTLDAGEHRDELKEEIRRLKTTAGKFAGNVCARRRPKAPRPANCWRRGNWRFRTRRR